jgi:hypothetical protein
VAHKFLAHLLIKTVLTKQFALESDKKYQIWQGCIKLCIPPHGGTKSKAVAEESDSSNYL